jgi:eukaryotic-like serine/threonine-protein kinase
LDLAGGTGANIGALSVEGDRKWTPLLQEKHSEGQPKVSPDGRWIAYNSTESGKDEIYVRPFPEVNKGRWQVSTGGGNTPLWSRDGRELFYRNGDSVLAVGVQTAPIFEAGKPQVLFEGKYVGLSFIDGHPWDVSPDGKRFLMIKEPRSAPSSDSSPSKINVVLNWLEELKQRVPVQ